jgi:hypothetical protein
MTPAAMLLYILLGIGLDRLWLARYEVFGALMGALDRLCTDPEPPGPAVAAPRSCVRTLRAVDAVRDGDEGDAA